MAKDKNSFVFYVDWYDTFKALPDDKAGQLLKHILAYVSDENPETEDVLINATFANIKNTLKRDLKTYEAKCLKNKQNGKKGGRPKKTQKNQTVILENPTKAKKPDSDSDSDNDNVINKRVYRKFAHLSLSLEDFEKLKDDYTKEQIDYILDSIENYKKNTSYKSLYLTAKKWLLKEYPKQTGQRTYISLPNLQVKYMNELGVKMLTPEQQAEVKRDWETNYKPLL